MKNLNYEDNSDSYFSKTLLYSLSHLCKNSPEKIKSILSPLFEDTTNKTLKIQWVGNEPSLKLLYDELKRRGAISCEWEFFKLHFLGTEPTTEKITWLLKINVLVYLFARLRDEKLIAISSTPHLQLEEHFLNEYGNPLKAGSLRSLLDKGVRNDKHVNSIEDIIERLLKANKARS